MKRPIEGEKESKRDGEGELNREMKMALLLLSEQRNERTRWLPSKKETNDTVI